MNDNMNRNYNPYDNMQGPADPFGQQNFGFNIPKFPIRQIKRIAHNRLKGHVFELLPAFLIYFILMVIPMGIVYTVNNLTNLEDVQTLLQAGNDPAALVEAAQQTANAATASDPLTSFLEIYILIATGPLTLGFCTLILRFLRGGEFGPSTMFEGFKRPFQPILIAIAMDIISTLCATAAALPISMGLLGGTANSLMIGAICSIVLLVFVVIISIRLKMSFYIASDDRSMSFFTCMKASWTLMKGNVKRYFLLMLSFIGWMILAAIPFSIAEGFFKSALSQGLSSATTWSVIGLLCLVGLIIYIPVTLYIQISEAVFYSNLSGNFSTVNRTPEPPAPEQQSLELQ